MQGGWIVAGLVLILLGVILFFTIICTIVGIVLGVLGIIMLIYGLVASDKTVVVQQYQTQPIQHPYYQQPQQTQPYGQSQPQYPPQQPQYPQQQPQYQPQQQPADPPQQRADPLPMSEPDLVVDMMICPKCGSENLPEVTYCGQCGENIKEQIPLSQ